MRLGLQFLAAAAAALFIILPLASLAISSRPNLIIFIADDLGYGNVGYHHAKSEEVKTPNLDSLAENGVRLERFYAYRLCSPSRSSFQTGRLPVHVNTENTSPTVTNPRDPISGYAGIPRNMTCIAEKLKQWGDYRTVFTGKWDVGMATPRHTPRGRGYDEFLGYFHHANDYWTCAIPPSLVDLDVCDNRYLDLWHNDGPARNLAKTGTYEELLFENHTIRMIETHNHSVPLFLVHSFHLVHTPLQLPQAWLDKFAFIDYENRRKYAAMVSYMDASVGRIISALKRRDMFDNSLVLFFSDNGGPIYNPGSANNFPLRGGKFSDFEGGIRVNALVAGGVIPPSRRGAVSHNLMHVADMYASLLRIAMFDLRADLDNAKQRVLREMVFDEEAHAVGLPPVDSLNVLWGAIIGETSTEMKRTELHISMDTLISGELKLMMGRQPMNIWQGEQYPNATGFQPNFFATSMTLRRLRCVTGCLFNILRDPTEHEDLKRQYPHIVRAMIRRLRQLNRSEFKPHRGWETQLACKVAQELHDGFYGPFLDLPGTGRTNQVKLASSLDGRGDKITSHLQ